MPHPARRRSRDARRRRRHRHELDPPARRRRRRDGAVDASSSAARPSRGWAQGVDAERPARATRRWSACSRRSTSYREAIDAPRRRRRHVAVLTSAVRDAANGARVRRQPSRERYGLDARTSDRRRGGAADVPRRDAAERDPDDADAALVDRHRRRLDRVRRRRAAATSDFHVSTQAGVVRQTERHLARRPAARRGARGARRRRPRDLRARPCPTPSARARRPRRSPSPAPRPRCAAIDLRSSTPTTPRASTATCCRATPRRRCSRGWRRCRSSERREVAGLHPDRAPTIVAGVVDPARGAARLRPRRGRGLRARHPARGARARRPHASGRAHGSAALERALDMRLPHSIRRRALDDSNVAPAGANGMPVGASGRASRCLEPVIGPGEAASIGASRRPGHPITGPCKARTPARPDGATIEAAPPRAASLTGADRPVARARCPAAVRRGSTSRG